MPLYSLKKIGQLASTRQAYLRGVGGYNAGWVQSYTAAANAFYPEYITADVLEKTEHHRVEIGFDKITVSTKLPSKSVRMLTPENFTPYDYEVYGIEDYLNDLYNSRQPFGQLITSAEQHPEQEVGFSFYFPPQAPATPILTLIRLLDESGFYM